MPFCRALLTCVVVKNLKILSFSVATCTRFLCFRSNHYFTLVSGGNGYELGAASLSCRELRLDQKNIVSLDKLQTWDISATEWKNNAFVFGLEWEFFDFHSSVRMLNLQCAVSTKFYSLFEEAKLCGVSGN